MLQKVKQFLQTAMCCSIGVYIGRAVWLWFDYKAHPGLYAMNSAPWYTPLLFGAVITAGILLAEGLALFFVNRQAKKGPVHNQGGKA